jgi:hypothetical protein
MSACPASSLAESLTLVGWLERLFAMFAKQRRNDHDVGTPVALNWFGEVSRDLRREPYKHHKTYGLKRLQ